MLTWLAYTNENQSECYRLTKKWNHKKKNKRKQHLEKTLKTKISDKNQLKRSRQKRKENLEKFIAEHPDSSNLLQVRSRSGRPRIKESQPLLLKTITDIAIHGSAAHKERQSDIYRSIKTLDELNSELKQVGFKISRSAVYLRLLPRRSSSMEGKRHVVTCPVKLVRSQMMTIWSTSMAGFAQQLFVHRKK